jgi:hypothetical protein
VRKREEKGEGRRGNGEGKGEGEKGDEEETVGGYELETESNGEEW